MTKTCLKRPKSAETYAPHALSSTEDAFDAAAQEAILFLSRNKARVLLDLLAYPKSL